MKSRGAGEEGGGVDGEPPPNLSVHPEPPNVISFINRVFEGVNKVRMGRKPSWITVGPKSN